MCDDEKRTYSAASFISRRCPTLQEVVERLAVEFLFRHAASQAYRQRGNVHDGVPFLWALNGVGLPAGIRPLLGRLSYLSSHHLNCSPRHCYGFGRQRLLHHVIIFTESPSLPSFVHDHAVTSLLRHIMMA